MGVAAFAVVGHGAAKGFAGDVSPVTVLMTAGPVMCMMPVPSTMKM